MDGLPSSVHWQKTSASRPSSACVCVRVCVCGVCPYISLRCDSCLRGRECATCHLQCIDVQLQHQDPQVCVCVCVVCPCISLRCSSCLRGRECVTCHLQCINIQLQHQDPQVCVCVLFAHALVWGAVHVCVGGSVWPANCNTLTFNSSIKTLNCVRVCCLPMH